MNTPDIEKYVEEFNANQHDIACGDIGQSCDFDTDAVDDWLRTTLTKATEEVRADAYKAGYEQGKFDGDYEARADEREKMTHHWNKAEQRLDGTAQGAVNAIEQFRNYLTQHHD